MLSRTDFEVLDKQDVLADRRKKFVIPEGHIYLDGNSLGAMPRSTEERLVKVVRQEWGHDLIRSWNTHDWVGCQLRVGDKIAPIVGADPGEVVVCDSTSVNLFKLAVAALQMNPGKNKIVTEAGNFPTDLYILEGVESFSNRSVELHSVARENVTAVIDEDTALVVLTHVHYKTGEMFDMAEITAMAQRKGALVLWDLSHSAGAVPLHLNSAGVDFAVGCGYKYLNGGPGAPSFLFVAKRHQSLIHSPLSGWFGHAAPFEFVDAYAPSEGVGRFQCGTPSVLAVAALEVGVEIMAVTDMTVIREKSVTLGNLFIELIEQRCPEFSVVSPRNSDWRGSQVALRHRQGYAIMRALIERNIIGDFRAPDILRFGFTPLYVRYVDIWDCVDGLVEIMQQEQWNQEAFLRRTAVT